MGREAGRNRRQDLALLLGRQRHAGELVAAVDAGGRRLAHQGVGVRRRLPLHRRLRRRHRRGVHDAAARLLDQGVVLIGRDRALVGVALQQPLRLAPLAALEQALDLLAEEGGLAILHQLALGLAAAQRRRQAGDDPRQLRLGGRQRRRVGHHRVAEAGDRVAGRRERVGVLRHRLVLQALGLELGAGDGLLGLPLRQLCRRDVRRRRLGRRLVRRQDRRRRAGRVAGVVRLLLGGRHRRGDRRGGDGRLRLLGVLGALHPHGRLVGIHLVAELGDGAGGSALILRSHGGAHRRVGADEGRPGPGLGELVGGEARLAVPVGRVIGELVVHPRAQLLDVGRGPLLGLRRLDTDVEDGVAPRHAGDALGRRAGLAEAEVGGRRRDRWRRRAFGGIELELVGDGRHVRRLRPCRREYRRPGLAACSTSRAAA